ncbi:NYN domain-containing protein [Sinomonas sp. ASV486]|uniref:NYN domain-containing protein n=1 Tax=Sinomonas sp. ASV486 TaxID=3051170 RepID=UPI0027DCEB06|nr:NYN domain-containing protein [Sinomonas sp. ASV486]MDQ4489819.1 NYN domain-containing protein [Sinomonas sp. ASV486]
MDRQYSPSRATKVRGLRGRTLYVVDLENMACTCEPSAGDVARIRTRIHAAVEPGHGDHTVIAVSHHNAPAAYFGWTGSAQRLARSGKDGADTALLEVIEDILWVAAHYDQVVLASGDHAFAYAVAALKAAGIRVVVISPDRGFSEQMRLAAGRDLVRLGPSIPSNVIALFTETKDAV